MKGKEFIFFKELFGEMANGLRIELRLINRHEDKVKRLFFSSVEEFIVATKRQEPRWDHYFGVNPRLGEKGTNDAVRVVTCVWADVDFKNFGGSKEATMKAIQKFPLPPTVVISTGHGFQPYWLLKEPEQLDDREGFQAAVRGVQDRLHSDPVADLARVLRVPGTLNYKEKQKIVPCEIIFSDYSRRYVLSDFEPFAVPIERNQSAPPLPRIIPHGQRNSTLASLAGSMRRRSASEEAIFLALEAENNRCQPPLADDELRSIANSISRYPSAPISPKSGTIEELLSFAGVDRLTAESSFEEIEKALRQLVSSLKGSDALRYQVVCEATAQQLKEIGVSKSLVRTAFSGSKTESGQENGQGKRIILADPEPWTEEVDGEQLLDEIVQALERFVVLPSGGSEAIALWTVHTHAHDAFRISPILALTSPQKRCGKSTVFDVLMHLVPRLLAVSDIIGPALFRSVEKYRPTLLGDEADSWLPENEDLRRVFNSGHCRDRAYTTRCAGDDHEPRLFSTWAPKALAAILGKQGKRSGMVDLPGTIRDRSIVIPMQRKRRGESIQKFRVGRPPEELETLCRKACRWASDHLGALRSAEPRVLTELDDRATDNWDPLFAIADLVGGKWPALSRKAAKQLCNPEAENSAGVLLLADVKEIFEQTNRDDLWSQTIVDELAKMEVRPWPEWKKGKPITVRQLASLLKPFEIAPKKEPIWIGKESHRGYEKSAFEDAWARYLGNDPSEP